MSEKWDKVVYLSPRRKDRSKEPSDAELLSAYTSGDAKAFDVFYERHRKGLYGHAMRWTNYQHADADDVIMDVFLQFTKKLLDKGGGEKSYIEEKFGSDGSAEAYLFTMIRNQAIKKYRLAYKKNEISFEMEDSNNDGSSYREYSDKKSIEKERAKELQQSVIETIWFSVHELERSLASTNYLIDKKRINKEIAKKTEQAEQYVIIYDLLMAGISTEKIAIFIGIDRGTLQKRIKLLREILRPLLSELT